MYRHNRKKSSFNDLLASIGLFFLALVIFVYLPKQFQTYGWFLVLVIYLIAVFLSLFALYLYLTRRNKERKLEHMLEQVVQNKQEEYIKNFINRFGKEKASTQTWYFREHGFTWDRLRDLSKILNENGVTVSVYDFKDVSMLLRHYIQQDEEKLTRVTYLTHTKELQMLKGTEFENLLVRLFTTKGYTVQHSGKVGDQGCDIILNSSDARCVVQAKRYTSLVNNSAIQEAVAAKRFYDCNKAMVVTSSGFTEGAMTLAKANEVELIDYKQLIGWLQKYLNESWT